LHDNIIYRKTVALEPTIIRNAGGRPDYDTSETFQASAGIFARAENDVLRIWCAPHQIDIVVKAAAEGIKDGIYVKQAYTFSVYLRAQDILIIEMNVKCPKKTNKWVHIGRLLLFYKSYRRPIMKHSKEKRADMIPADNWWVITYAVSPAIDSINVTFAELQTNSLLISLQ
jgi:hypothetical protein